MSQGPHTSVDPAAGPDQTVVAAVSVGTPGNFVAALSGLAAAAGPGGFAAAFARPRGGVLRGFFVPPGRHGPQHGRNGPCPCGSKKKFKRCHGAPEASVTPVPLRPAPEGDQ